MILKSLSIFFRQYWPTGKNVMKIFRLPLKILLPLIAISLFSVASFASTVGVSTATIQGQGGVLYNVTGGFTVTSNGFSVQQAAGTASTQPCAWTSSGTCQTALVQGDWVYSMTVTISASATTSHTYTATVDWNTGGSTTVLGSLTLTTPATITAGQTMTFLFDSGVTTFNAPAAITITIQ